MEKENYYYNLDNLTILEYYRAIKRGDKRVLFHLARKVGYGFGSGIMTTGVGLQKKVAETVRP